MPNRSTVPVHLRDERRTPRFMYDYAVRRWGPMHIDLAATTENALCHLYFTKEDSALDCDWITYAAAHHGSDVQLRGWCNPPYSDPDPWVRHAIREAAVGFETIMLLPSLNGERRDALILDHALEIVWVVGRVRFELPERRREPGNERGSIFVRFGPTHGAERLTIAVSYVRRAQINPDENRLLKPDGDGG